MMELRHEIWWWRGKVDGDGLEKKSMTEVMKLLGEYLQSDRIKHSKFFTY